MGEKLTDVFMQLFCEKNSDDTRNLVLKGKDLFQRIGRRIQKGDDMVKICKFLHEHPEIVSLDLSYNNFGDYGFNILIDQFLHDANNLLELNVMWCDITEKSISNLVSLPHLKLRALRLNGNKFGPEGGKQLALLLTYTDTILHLDLGETNQTLSSVPYFWKVLNHSYFPNGTLRVVDFSRIIPSFDRYQYDSGHLAESIGHMLQCNHSLIEIHLQKNQLNAHDIELMLVGLAGNNKLLMLDLGFNRIADYGVELIANHLKLRPSLLGLNVAANGITNIGARAISQALPLSRVRLLDIGHNKINDIGMQDILQAIKKPVQMRMLNIWGNRMSHSTSIVIQRMLEAKVLDQNYLDVKIYQVDKFYYTAYYPSDRYKHKYYGVMDYAYPPELKIKRNEVVADDDKPRALVHFTHYPRIPPANK